jgi:hypothetical protein
VTNTQKLSKIALCFSGLPNIDLFSIRTLLDQTDLDPSTIDLYCCFWDVDVDNEKIDALVEVFNEVNVTFIKPSIFDYVNLNNYLKFPETNVARVLSMVGIRKTLRDILANSKKIYNTYIITRPDIFFTEPIKITSYIDLLGIENDVFVPKAGGFRNGYTDVFAIANYKGAKNYLDLDNYLQNVLLLDHDSYCKNNFGRKFVTLFHLFASFFLDDFDHKITSIPLHPEILVKKNLEWNSIKVGFLDISGIIIKRSNRYSLLPTISKQSVIMLAGSIVCESIKSVDLSVTSVFKQK